jgi:hypothetical protein
MKFSFFLLSLLLLLVGACKEEPIPLPEPEPEPIPTADYADYLTPVADAVYKESLDNGAAISPTYWPQDEYAYWFPCFNPNDPYEIAYLRGQGSECHEEVFVFSFRTGEATKVADNACYGLDWSSKGWLLFTGIDRKVWKVKTNGDSLTQLTFGQGFHNGAVWSPDGQWFLFERQLRDVNGQESEPITEPFRFLVWINDSTMLGSHRENEKGLIQYTLPSRRVESLFPGENLLGISYFKPEEMAIYVQPTLKRWDYFLRFDLQAQQIDTLRQMYFTYKYGLGDYAPQTERAILQLHRRDWKDSVANEIYFRRHLLMLDEEGNEMGIVQLPE